MATTLTRRELAAALAGAGLVPAMAQSQDGAAGEPLEAARQQIRESVGKLEEFDLPTSTAPAFVFEP